MWRQVTPANAQRQLALSNHYRFEAGGTRLVGLIPHTDSWNNYQQGRLGRIELTAGPQRVVFRGEPPLHDAIIDLREVRLLPADQAAPADFTNLKAGYPAAAP